MPHVLAPAPKTELFWPVFTEPAFRPNRELPADEPAAVPAPTPMMVFVPGALRIRFGPILYCPAETAPAEMLFEVKVVDFNVPVAMISPAPVTLPDITASPDMLSVFPTRSPAVIFPREMTLFAVMSPAALTFPDTPSLAPANGL